MYIQRRPRKYLKYFLRVQSLRLRGTPLSGDGGQRGNLCGQLATARKASRGQRNTRWRCCYCRRSCCCCIIDKCLQIIMLHIQRSGTATTAPWRPPRRRCSNPQPTPAPLLYTSYGVFVVFLKLVKAVEAIVVALH